MGVWVEGIGKDWVVVRDPGGRPRLVAYSDTEGMRKAMARVLLKSETRPLPVVAAPPELVKPDPPKPDPKPFSRRNGSSRAGKTVAVALELDCKACGACCVTDKGKDRIAQMDKDEAMGIPAQRQRHLVLEEKGDYWTRTKVNSQGYTVCAALSGSVKGSCQCSVYESRPMVCLLFDAGSKECLAARKALGV